MLQSDHLIVNAVHGRVYDTEKKKQYDHKITPFLNIYLCIKLPLSADSGAFFYSASANSSKNVRIPSSTLHLSSV